MDTVRRICRFDDDEQPGDRNAKQKALLEFVCTVLPKDVVDTGVEAGLHPDLITVLSTYSSGFVRSDDMLDDSINNKPKDHLWAMLKLNECGMPFHKSSKLAKHNPDTCDSRRWY
ncbi:hypothetical protein GGH15_001883 [Coemansia sp. RSA 562]|nr:hypothetical protein GGH15_001883 [Coemansia sp. RSA 562]